MASIEPILTVSDLKVLASSGEQDRTLVRDVNFNLHRGQSLGIVGESGSGKSMTLKSLVQLLPEGVRAEGTIAFDGESVLDKGEKQMRKLRGAKLGLLMQDPFTMLNPLQTVGASIAESLPREKRTNRDTTRQEVAKRLAEVGLEAYVANKHPFQLSGGMRQRVAIAAALACDPEILLADEPTTALDVTVQAEVLQLIERIRAERNMALILVTHDLQVAFSVCERVLVMYSGSIVEEGDASSLMEEPRHPYSLGLMLSDLASTHYLDQLTTIPGSVPSPDSVASRCSFADRCEWAQDLCFEARPTLERAGVDHSSACLRTEEIRTEMGERRALIERRGMRKTSVGSPLLTVEKLQKTYLTQPMFGRRQKTIALDGVSFSINEGESLGLLGESGSGKTTIARSLLGLTTPDSGRIELDGVDLSSYSRLTNADRGRARAMLQVVFQDPYSSLNPSLSIGSAIGEALNLRSVVGTSKSPSVEDMLSMVSLPPDYSHRRPADLSGGERQRVAIARALAVNPRLLVCDEPVAALDVSVQAQVIELLREIQAQHGVSLLFITHDLAVARQATDRVIVLYKGKIVEEGPTDSVMERPDHPYTQRLLRSIPRASERGEASAAFRGAQRSREGQVNA